MSELKDVKVIVMGDVNYDIQLIAEASESGEVVNVHETKAGAWQLSKLISHVLDQKDLNVSVIGQLKTTHSSNLPKCILDGKRLKTKTFSEAWRWKKALGYSPRNSSFRQAKLQSFNFSESEKVIFVFDEKEFGFSNADNIWGDIIETFSENIEHILYRTRNPNKDQKLYKKLSTTCLLNKTILFLTTNDLRRIGYNIHSGCSWDTLISVLIKEIFVKGGPATDIIKECFGVIVQCRL